MLRYSSSLFFFLFICTWCQGQNKFIPEAYRVGVDLTGIGYTVFGTDNNHFEINNDFQYGKKFLVIDLGVNERTYTREDFIYNNSGRFFRVGLDYNFIPKDPDNNVIFVGARYGRSFFNDNIQFEQIDPLFENQAYYYSNEKVRGSWLEANAGMKVRIWKSIFLGYTFRLKFARTVKGDTQLEVYELPGYGKAAKPSVFAFSYHVFYRIPLPKRNSTAKNLP